MKDFRMSHKEADQIIILDSIIKGQISQKDGALILGLSVRQVRRKLIRYLKEGTPGLCHKARGKKSNRSLSQELRTKIIELITTLYPKLGPTLAAEKLADNHQISIDHETLRRLMIKEGRWQVHQRKFIKHVWRERKMCFGELVQVDGSYHKWFNDEYTTLIAFIDDATGCVELMFHNHETIEGLAKITKYGRPSALYTDCGKVYKVNRCKEGKKCSTQYERMLRELDIEIIHAYSPQAKGRVERLFKTLQDRLVKELELRKITTMDEANKFLQEVYIDIFNKKFKKAPKNDINLHRPLEGYDLNSTFSIKESRILNNDRTVKYKDRLLLLKKDQPVQLYKRCHITVQHHFDGTIALTYQNKRLNYKEVAKMPLYKERRPDRVIQNKSYRPPRNHPWRSPGQIGDTSKESKKGHS